MSGPRTAQLALPGTGRKRSPRTPCAGPPPRAQIPLPLDALFTTRGRIGAQQAADRYRASRIDARHPEREPGYRAAELARQRAAFVAWYAARYPAVEDQGDDAAERAALRTLTGILGPVEVVAVVTSQPRTNRGGRRTA